MSTNPYRLNEDESFRPLPQQRGSTGKLVVGIIAAVVLLMVGSCIALGVWGVSFGMGVLGEEIKLLLRDHPQVKEHLGELQTLDVNWTKSAAVEGENVFIYEATGSKASGELTVESVTQDSGDERIVAASLRLNDGTVVEIDVSLIEHPGDQELP